MKCNEIETLLSAYADGEVTKADAARIRAHVAQCRSCAAKLEALNVLQSKLREVMNEPVEGIDYSDIVMAYLPAKTSNTPRRWVWALAAAVVAVVLWRITMPVSYQPKVQNVITKRPIAPQPKVVKHEQDTLEKAPVIARKTEKKAPKRFYAKAQMGHRHHHIEPIIVKQESDNQLSEYTPIEVSIGIRANGTSVELRTGSAVVPQPIRTEIEIQPNKNAASIVRPPLEVVRNSTAPPAKTVGG